jgi:hypothetical protein
MLIIFTIKLNLLIFIQKYNCWTSLFFKIGSDSEQTLSTLYIEENKNK